MTILTLDRPLIALDLETNGLGTPEQMRIVEIGFHIEYHDGREPKRCVSLINPGVSIALEAIKVHGISNEKIQSCQRCGYLADLHQQGNLLTSGCEGFKPVPTFAQIAPNLAKGFTDCDFAGYNVRFDLRVLVAEFARVGVECDLSGARLLDAFHLWRIGYPRTLSDAVREFLHREPTEAHRALGDAEDALEVSLAQVVRFNLPRNVSQLHDLCFDSSRVDPEGRFIWNSSGEIICNFGAHVKKPLKAMPTEYLEWMLKGDFSGDVKRLVKNALNNVYPKRS